MKAFIIIAAILTFLLCLLIASVVKSVEGAEMSKEQERLNELEPWVRLKIEALLGLARKRWPNHRIVLAETYRTQERQDELFAKGPTTTTVKVSMHTKRKAADIYFVNGKRILGYEEAPYLELGIMAEGLGLRWGGRWKVPFDPNHFELPNSQAGLVP